jgi:hypothetical protein
MTYPKGDTFAVVISDVLSIVSYDTQMNNSLTIFHAEPRFSMMTYEPVAHFTRQLLTA